MLLSRGPQWALVILATTGATQFCAPPRDAPTCWYLSPELVPWGPADITALWTSCSPMLLWESERGGGGTVGGVHPCCTVLSWCGLDLGPKKGRTCIRTKEAQVQRASWWWRSHVPPPDQWECSLDLVGLWWLGRRPSKAC